MLVNSNGHPLDAAGQAEVPPLISPTGQTICSGPVIPQPRSEPSNLTLELLFDRLHDLYPMVVLIVASDVPDDISRTTTASLWAGGAIRCIDVMQQNLNAMIARLTPEQREMARKIGVTLPEPEPAQTNAPD